MGGFNNPIIGGGGSLVYPSIHSPDFVTGVSGWTINKDGSAEFDNLVIRGTFNGTDFEITSKGAFFYSGTGALKMAIASQNTTDPVHGIQCYQGLQTFNAHGAVLWLQSTIDDATFFYLNTGTSTQGALAVSIAGAATTDPFGNTISQPGMVGYGSGSAVQAVNPATGAFAELTNAILQFGIAAIFTAGGNVQANKQGVTFAAPWLQLQAPEESGSLDAAALTLFGGNTGGTTHGQALLADSASATPATTALLEVQGELAVTTGGAQVTGNSKITGTLETTSALTVDAGGAQVTGNSKITGTLETTSALTVDAGGASVTGGTSTDTLTATGNGAVEGVLAVGEAAAGAAASNLEVKTTIGLVGRGAAPGTPPAGTLYLYYKTGGSNGLYVKDSGGTAHLIASTA